MKPIRVASGSLAVVVVCGLGLVLTPGFRLSQIIDFNLSSATQRPTRLRGTTTAEQSTHTGRQRGTVILRGAVTDESDQPVPAVLVRVMFLGGAVSGRTDTNGRFEFASLPVGRTALSAEKSGYVSTYYGQHKYAHGPIGWLSLSNNNAQIDVILRLTHGSAINGRITSDTGAPVSEAVVTAVPTGLSDGRDRELLAIQNASAIARPFENSHVRTDRLGQFRIEGLASGAYYLIAATAGGSNRRSTFYFPGTPDPERAQVLPLSHDSEVVANISIAPVHYFNVNGVVNSRDRGRASGGFVRMIQLSSTGAPLPATTVGAGIDNKGRFRAAAPAGNYLLLATSGSPWHGLGVQRPVETGRRCITLKDRDLTDVTVLTAPGATVFGSVSTSAGQPLSESMSLRIAAIPSDGVSDVLGSAPVQADGTFHLRNVFGRNLLRLASLDERVWVKAVYVDGNDVSDSGIIAESGQQIHATVVLGEPEAEVSGRVSDGARSHTGNAAVIVFAATEALWTHPLNRYSRVTRSSDTGKYSLTGLPQGDYLAVALDDIDMVTAVRPAFLARLRAVATRIKFNGSSKQYVDLAVQKVLQ